MSANRRVPALRRRVDMSELGRWERHALETGAQLWERFTDEDLRRLWSRWRTQLLREWIEQHPGTRPWAWWQFEVRHPRRRIDGGPDVIEQRRQAGETGMALDRRFGLPRCWKKGEFGAKYESEPAYLERLGLLRAGERERIQERTGDPA